MTSSKTKSKKPERFEKKLSRLEAIIEKLEDGNLDLEDAMQQFEEGVALSAECQAWLEKTDKKIRRLLDAQGISIDAVAEEDFEK